jgi:hypothetical protein
MTTKLSENYPTQLVRKPGANNYNILLLMVYYSSEDCYIFHQYQFYFSQLTIAPNHRLHIKHYRKQLISMTAAIVDVGLLQDAFNLHFKAASSK